YKGLRAFRLLSESSVVPLQVVQDLGPGCGQPMNPGAQEWLLRAVADGPDAVLRVSTVLRQQAVRVAHGVEEDPARVASFSEDLPLQSKRARGEARRRDRKKRDHHGDARMTADQLCRAAERSHDARFDGATFEETAELLLELEGRRVARVGLRIEGL